MGFWSQAGTFIRIIAIIWAVIIGLWLLKVSAMGAAKLIDPAFLTVERRIYQWLQDRAKARPLGVPVDVVRIRRRIESTDKPINIPTSDGAKRHC